MKKLFTLLLVNLLFIFVISVFAQEKNKLTVSQNKNQSTDTKAPLAPGNIIIPVNPPFMSPNATATCYPNITARWTGSCNSSSVTQTSLMVCTSPSGASNAWAKFNISSIPAGSTITAITLSMYVNSSTCPYFYVRKVTADPVTATVATLNSQISGGTLFSSYGSCLSTGAYNTITLTSAAYSDLASCISQGWWAVGFYEYESSSYTFTAQGQAQANKPYITVTYTAGAANDVGPLSIDFVPATYPNTFSPKATVKNFGTANQTSAFNVNMTINPGAYSSTVAITPPLNTGLTQQLSFASWTPVNGTLYTIKVTTQLAGDGNAGNDTLTSWTTPSLGGWYTGNVISNSTYFATCAGYVKNDTGFVFSLGGNSTNKTEVSKYNVNTNVWTTVAPIPAARNIAASAVLLDTLYLIGGVDASSVYQNTVYRYDINANIWSTTTNAPLPGAVGFAKAVGYQDSLIYLAGGYNGTSVFTQVLLYNNISNTWRTATSLPLGRFAGAFSISGDTLVYVGGSDLSVAVATTYRGIINQTDRCIISWSAGANYPSGVRFRWDASNFYKKGIIVTGGSSLDWTTPTNECYTYSPGANVWTRRWNKPSSVMAASVSTVYTGNNKWNFVAASGYNGTAILTATEVFKDTILSIPTRPFLIYPANGSGGISITPTLDWYDLTNISSYRVQVATDAAFSSIVVDQSGIGSSQYNVTGGLSIGNVYYWRVNATNAQGTGPWSYIFNFSTCAVAPSLITASPSGISNNSAIGGGTITSDGGSSVLTSGVCWSTSANPTISDSKTTDGGTTVGVPWTSTMTSLSSGTTYHVRAYATNSIGTGYGSDIMFTTIASPPWTETFEGISAAGIWPAGWSATANASTYTSSPGYGITAHGGTKFAAFHYSGGDKWMYSCGLYLTAGNSYDFSMWYQPDTYSGWTFLGAYYGTSQTPMTTNLINSVANPTGNTYLQMTGNITPVSTGIYYIGIKCTDNGVPWYIGIDDVSLTVSASQSYLSSTVTQTVTTPVSAGSANNQIVGIQVVMNGALNPLSLYSLMFDVCDPGSGGTTNINDIQNAKVYYTGTNGTFNTSTLFGSVSPLNPYPNPLVISNGSGQTLANGTNYFWLTYDLNPCPTVGNVIDAECTLINIGNSLPGTEQIPGVTNPTGNRTIGPSSDFGGPTAGYYFSNSSPGASCALSQPVFDWFDTTGSTSLILNSTAVTALSGGTVDDGYYTINLPAGKFFRFMGTNYNIIQIGTNGYVSFGVSGYTSYSPVLLPSASAPLNTLFAFWTDFRYDYQTSASFNRLSYKPIPADDHILITFNNAPFEALAGTTHYITFQIILNTSDSPFDNSNFVVQFSDTQSGTGWTDPTTGWYYTNGINHLVGFQSDGNAGNGMMYRFVSGGSVNTSGRLISSPVAIGFSPNQSTLPVELTSFLSSVNMRDVKLNWTTSKEINNRGFEILRSNTKDNLFSKIGFINGKGNSRTTSNYTFEEKKLQSGKYKYRLKQIDYNGNSKIYDLNNIVEIGIPTKYNISQNYPNPFNPVTKIDYDLPYDSKVRIVIYDMLGREMKNLINNENIKAGYYTAELNATNLASGVYIYRILADATNGKNFIATKKMVVIK